MRLNSGIVVANRFILERRLSSNARAQVWKTKDSASGRTYAVKLFACEQELDPIIIKLLREEFASRSLKHPGILLPLHFDVEGTTPFLVLPYFASGSLRDRLAAEPSAGFDERRLVAFVGAMAGALSHLHRNTFVHQDICPENILFAAPDRQQLSDFGINRIIHTTLGHAGGPGRIVHPAYASPERCGGEAAQFPDDIFALGAVLYEIASGTQPWGGRGGQAMLDDDAGLPMLDARWSDACETMIRSCLHRYSEQRPTVDALRRWAADYTPPVGPPLRHAAAAAAKRGAPVTRAVKIPDTHAGGDAAASCADPGAARTAASAGPAGNGNRDIRILRLETCMPSAIALARENAEKVAAAAPGAEASSADEPLAVRIPLSMLVAEDNIVSAALTRRLLQRLGYMADVVSTGVEALSCIGASQYDIVFMDIQMPVMDGCQAARIITTKYGCTAGPVIIAMTASAGKSDVESYKRAGMQDCLPKPMSLASLRGMIETWGPKAIVRRRKTPAGGNTDIIDMRKIRELQELDEGDGPSFVRDMIMYFLQDATELMMQLRQSIDRRYGTDIIFHAHKLRGSCLSLGLAALADVCAAMESDAKRSDINSVVKSKPTLSTVFENTVAELHTLCNTLPG
jgi:CheY-like chemotaxis protein